MKCNMKTMITSGVVLLVALAGTYAALPQFRALVLSIGPTLLFLLCPLSMLFMIWSMRSSKDNDRSPPGDTTQERQSQPRITK